MTSTCKVLENAIRERGKGVVVVRQMPSDLRLSEEGRKALNEEVSSRIKKNIIARSKSVDAASRTICI